MNKGESSCNKKATKELLCRTFELRWHYDHDELCRDRLQESASGQLTVVSKVCRQRDAHDLRS